MSEIQMKFESNLDSVLMQTSQMSSQIKKVYISFGNNSLKIRIILRSVGLYSQLFSLYVKFLNFKLTRVTLILMTVLICLISLKSDIYALKNQVSFSSEL